MVCANPPEAPAKPSRMQVAFTPTRRATIENHIVNELGTNPSCSIEEAMEESPENPPKPTERYNKYPIRSQVPAPPPIMMARRLLNGLKGKIKIAVQKIEMIAEMRNAILKRLPQLGLASAMDRVAVDGAILARP